MNINMYKKTGLFFGLATLIPWTFWFLAGYISHIEPANITQKTWVSIIAFLGLLALYIIALLLLSQVNIPPLNITERQVKQRPLLSILRQPLIRKWMASPPAKSRKISVGQILTPFVNEKGSARSCPL